MPRPRVDYIVLNSTDASGGTNPDRSWKIQPHMYRQWQPRDEIVMKLISCSFNAVANNTVPNNLAIMGDMACSNQHIGSLGWVYLGTSTSRYTATGTISTADQLQLPHMELHTDRLNTLTIRVADSMTTALDISMIDCSFTFEIQYYQPAM